MKRWSYMVAAVVVLVVVIAGVKAYSVSQTIEHFKSQGAPKFTVSAGKAEMTPWQPTLSAVATLHAVHGADLSPEVAGIVDAIEFESGQDVKAGQLLVRLRAADDLAHLASLKATAALDQTVYTRDQVQFDAQAISQATLDSDAAALKVAQAQVDEQRAVADKKFIRAPFSGRVGIRAVDPGQYVAAGTKLVTLQALDPIYADFYLPQQDLAQIAVGQSVSVTASSAGEPVTGKIDAVNPQVDTNTRNMQVRASLRNPGLKLLPGMYVNVNVDTGGEQRYLTLPQTAVVYNPYGASVFVIKPVGAAPAARNTPPPTPNIPPAGQGDLTVEQRFIETGPTRGDQVAILKGIREGDLVVTSGQLKLKNGALVIVDNSVAPKNDQHPHPDNE
jgi:membrane fusion protein (multidrug efflux system)